MSKLNVSQRVPASYNTHAIADLLRQIEDQVNRLAEGRISGRHAASTAAPTAGFWAQGDVIYKSDPVEAGTAGSKYVVFGWICTVGGEPGTWLEMRALTGN